MAVAFVAIAAGCQSSSSDTAPPATTTTPAPVEDVSAGYVSQVATAQGTTISVYANPDDAEPMLELDNPWVIDPDVPDATVPQVFLIKEADPATTEGEVASDEWVEVLLPIRPNGSTGWVRRADVTIAENPYRIGIELAAKRITVTDAGSVVYEGAIASGKADTPTPTGTYYLRVLLEAPDPNTVYGPFAYGLSSHSEVFETFSGGDAEIGIHGNNDASVLGTDATAGCIRMDNDGITALTGLLPLGTPVDIVA